jgi:SAM-dependent methyltransferase
MDTHRPTDDTADSSVRMHVPREVIDANPGRDHPAVIFVEFVTTPQDVVDRMLELARVGPNDVVYDLGCGDGRIVITAAKKYGCRAVGFELDRLRVREARANAIESGVADRVTIELKDALTVDLRPATVVTLYLGTELNARLVPQLQQLPPGSRIVSHDFGIEGFPADETVRMTSREDNRDHLIHLWNGPLEAAR